MAAIKDKLATMPPRVNIPDDAKYCVIIHGKSLAVYCRHCGRFSKGDTMHTTLEHKGRVKTAYVAPTAGGSAPVPAPPPAPSPTPSLSGQLATFPTGMDPADVPVIDNDELFPGANQAGTANYDFGSMQAFQTQIDEDVTMAWITVRVLVALKGMEIISNFATID